MNRLLILILLSTTLACTQKETVKGDLVVRLMDFGSYYGIDESQIVSYNKYLDSIQENPDVEEHDKEFYDFISKIKKYGLIKKPYIFLRLPDHAVYRIYLSDKEYEKVKKYTYWELQRMNKKVEIEIELEKKDEYLYYSDRILQVSEVEGQTPWDE